MIVPIVDFLPQNFDLPMERHGVQSFLTTTVKWSALKGFGMKSNAPRCMA